MHHPNTTRITIFSPPQVTFEEFVEFWVAQPRDGSGGKAGLLRGISDQLMAVKNSADPALEGHVLYAFQLLDRDNSGSLDRGEVCAPSLRPSSRIWRRAF